MCVCVCVCVCVCECVCGCTLRTKYTNLLLVIPMNYGGQLNIQINLDIFLVVIEKCRQRMHSMLDRKEGQFEHIILRRYTKSFQYWLR